MTVEDWLTAGPIAHRGFYEVDGGAPENSLAAFRRAVTHRVPFEFDVQLTADGSVIVWHDAVLPRRGGGDVPVREATGADVREVRLDGSDERIPSLTDVLGAVDGAVPIVVDLRRWRLDLQGQLERSVADGLRAYAGPVAVQSFDPTAVHRLRRLLPDVPVGQASGELRSANAVVAALGRTMLTNAVTHPDFVTYELTRLPSFWASLWRDRGVPILAFPVDDERDEERARRLADNFFFAHYVPEEYRPALDDRGS